MKKPDSLYIGKLNFKPQYISNIFQKNNDGFYNNDALMYHDILRFSNDHGNFKTSKLADWLLHNNMELVNAYSDLSTRNIIYSKRKLDRKDRIDRIFNGLLTMGLVRVSGTRSALKLNMEVKVYSIEKSGKMILTVIRIISLNDELLHAKQRNNTVETQMKLTELEINYKNLYELVISMLAGGKNAPYQGIMLKTFLTKLQSEGLFSKFVEYVVLVCNTNDQINSIQYLLTKVLNYMFGRVPEKDLFSEIGLEKVTYLVI